MSLPWTCGDGYYVTWDPKGHWAEGKATGIAFDFATPEATPLYAPVSGVAYFLEDERPFETNFGHYVEIADPSGNWLLRLAHLRDAQTGERSVREGELIGYSGASGAYAAHLHLELLALEGESWVAPDMARLTQFLGFDLSSLVQGALITHDGCAPVLAMGGQVQPLLDDVPLGEVVTLVVPLRNDGLDALTLNTVQVMLYSPTGASMVAETMGEWHIDAVSDAAIHVPVRIPVVGDWYVGRVVYRADALSGGMPAKGRLRVEPPSLQVDSLRVPSPVLYTGDVLDLAVRLQNTGQQVLLFDDLVVEGTRPDGVSWQATVGRPVALSAGHEAEVVFHNSAVLQTPGVWQINRLGYRRGEQTFFFQQFDQVFYLFGPQLEAEQIESQYSDRVWRLFVTLRNIGTHTAYPDVIEVWGWRPDGETSFAASANRVQPIAVGEAALVRLDVSLEGDRGVWRLAEAGVWQEGVYYRIRLPKQAALAATAQSVSP
jgi:hypothetical protein